jgi:hypothetical protein
MMMPQDSKHICASHPVTPSLPESTVVATRTTRRAHKSHLQFHERSWLLVSIVGPAYPPTNCSCRWHPTRHNDHPNNHNHHHNIAKICLEIPSSPSGNATTVAAISFVANANNITTMVHSSSSSSHIGSYWWWWYGVGESLLESILDGLSVQFGQVWLPSLCCCATTPIRNVGSSFR